MNFTFEIVSRTHGTFTVTAPERFRKEVEAHAWHVSQKKTRVPGRDFVVGSTMKIDDKRKTISLHRFIWDLAGNPPTPEIDHKDGQPLNCGEDNLRAATRLDNQHNRGKRKNNSSGVLGVTVHKPGVYRATIAVNGKTTHIGLFRDISEAAAARDKAARETYGEFAATNGV